MVGFELEQWGHQTLQYRSNGYMESGFHFVRDSRTIPDILPPETKLKDLNEGRDITLRVMIKWADGETSRDEWLHIEYRNRVAIAAVHDSEELINLARRNVASPLLSNIRVDGRCNTCGNIPHVQSACSNCGDVCCHSCNDSINWRVGNAACFRCFPTVIKVVLNCFEEHNISEWVDDVDQSDSS